LGRYIKKKAKGEGRPSPLAFLKNKDSVKVSAFYIEFTFVYFRFYKTKIGYLCNLKVRKNVMGEKET